MKVKLNVPMNNFPSGAEIEVSPERGAIMLKDGTAREPAPPAPTTDNPPYSRFEGFGPKTEPLSDVKNKMVKPGTIHKK